MGRVRRQLVAVSALSVALSAVVLLFGALAVTLFDDGPPVRSAPPGSAGVLRVATPGPTPFATHRAHPHKTYVTAPKTTTPVAFRPAPSTPRPQPTARVRPQEAPKADRGRRRPARRPAVASHPTASVASVAPAPQTVAPKPATAPARVRSRPVRARGPKPKVSAPRARPPVASRPSHGPAHPPVPQRPEPKAPKKPKPAHARPAPVPAVTAPPAPAHGNNGQGPASPEAHGKGH